MTNQTETTLHLDRIWAAIQELGAALEAEFDYNGVLPDWVEDLSGALVQAEDDIRIERINLVVIQ